MPWGSGGANSNGGGKGPWKSGNPGPWGPGPANSRQPDIGEWLRNLGERFGKLPPRG